MKKYIFLIFLLTPLITTAAEPSILINELAWMGTTESANDEWLELYNNTDTDIDLTGWRLEAVDGSPIINLIGTIPAGGYFLLERTDEDTIPEISADQIYTGALGNNGEWLKLYNNNGAVIDEVNAAASWPAGDNTTKQTMERVDDLSWQTSSQAGGTPKTQNSQASSDDQTSENNNDQASTSTPPTADSTSQTPPGSFAAKKGDIVINEIFPNPIGPDNQNEFIEIKNISPSPIDLTNWQIKNAAGQIFTLPSLTMTPQSIVVFSRPQTNLILNNSKEKLKLYSLTNLIIAGVEYKTSAPENQSYQKSSDGNYYWGPISPNQENEFEPPVLPVINLEWPKQAKINEIISFDASDSYDPKNRPLTFRWNFGDGRMASGTSTRQIYLQTGNYEISLSAIVDQTASTTQKFKIKILDNSPTNSNQATATTTTTETLLVSTDFNQIKTWPNIFISEFLPNPAGPDTTDEFIEIFNAENYAVDLTGFKLDDNNGGSRPYQIPPKTIIQPNQYLAFYSKQTKIALNNDTDLVRLLAPSGEIIDQTEYQESQEGVSYVLDENFEWQQTNTPTPGEINVLNLESRIKNQELSEEEATTSTPRVLGASTENNQQPANKLRYYLAGASALVILGIGTVLKIKNR